MDRRQTLNFLEAFTTGTCPNGKTITEDIIDKKLETFYSVDLIIMSALKSILTDLEELKK